MKIKSVCENTGLTARTVRLYVEEELIAPAFCENYLGRRSYDFSEEDVEALKDIATLRTFGFSISDIRRIIESKENSRGIIKELCESKAKTISDEKNMLDVLLTLNNDRCYSIAEIAKELRTGSEKRELPEDDTMSKLMYYLKNPKEGIKVLLRIIDYLLLFGAIAFQLFLLLYNIFMWKYPHVYDWSLFCICLVMILLPIIVVLIIITVTKIRKKRVMKGLGILSVFLVVILLGPNAIISIFAPIESYTDSFDNYRNTDGSLIEDDPFLSIFLPKKHTADRNGTADFDAVYRYRQTATFDTTAEILVEWNLEEDEFSKEVERVEHLFESFCNYDGDGPNYSYVTAEKGDYKCIIKYYASGTKPFEKAEEDFRFYIFAYDENTRRVRYIYNSSGNNGAFQPFYIDLDW